jgi:hypothetical protein
MDLDNKIKSSIKDMSFIIKKTYRIALALNVISKSLFKNDPYYISLRRSSQELVEYTSLFGRKSLADKEIVFDVIEEVLSRTKKELFALFSSGDLSEKSFGTIDTAIEYVLKEVKGSSMPYREDRMDFAGAAFSGRGLVDDTWLQGEVPVFLGDTKKSVKDMSFTNSKEEVISTEKKQDKRHISNDKADRTNKILSFIKDKGEVTVKDIMSIADDVAPKTIQRDLQNLIDQGFVRKEGKRRWARYHYTK